MLSALHIQDFVLIDKAALTLAPGLTALTGETGAGKSILLDALGLAAGARAGRSAVRQGAKRGAVSATFDPPGDHPVWAILEDNGLGGDDDQIILRRIQEADGRSRGFVNDQPVSIGMLRAIGEALLEIHGQHDGRGFLSAAGHRALLDEFAGLQKKTGAVADLWRAWRTAERVLTERRLEQERAAREADYLRHVHKVLAALDPQPEEESALAERRAALMASEKIAGELSIAEKLLDEGGVDEKLGACARHIARAAAHLPEAPALRSAQERLEAALQETAEARAAIADAVSAFGAEPDELDQTEERLFALRAEARKHGVAPDALADFLKKVQTALDNVAQGEAAFTDLEREVETARRAYDAAAGQLSKARASAAQKLDAAVAKELAPLKLGKAQFITKVETDFNHPTSDGYDRVEFMVATNPGAPAGPLKTIASGGELSRFVLAMKAALSARENRTVIIFDEVDAGVGGAVADAVGERLARLAGDAQVLVVTHSPQVAARARNHWRIEKKQSKTATLTAVKALDANARVEEIARMLSGAQITEEARAAARRLLDASSPTEQPAPKKALKKSAKKLAKTG